MPINLKEPRVSEFRTSFRDRYQRTEVVIRGFRPCSEAEVRLSEAILGFNGRG
jgi:hypothetical protein